MACFIFIKKFKTTKSLQFVENFQKQMNLNCFMCLKTFQELVGFMKETEKDWQCRVGSLTWFFEFLEPRLKVKISIMLFGNLQLSLGSESVF
jgi:hypothetical protein